MEFLHFADGFLIRRDLSPTYTNLYPSVICSVIQQTIKVESIEVSFGLLSVLLLKQKSQKLLTPSRNFRPSSNVDLFMYRT